ncbi:MAG: 4-hydroxybenzoyl-CoA reductase [Candidatus Rokuibacteriota bacterium]|nr:MAG: 4-hydroxybenzoyl-CoA reductase [Candidatus Rokubacteria bacterium]PYN56730.1 MAG: 4-hydroxybenzoyl-CoA reductase [Candidatus Rokubacteria bacterium]
MIRLPSFTYLAPRTLAEAATAMAEHGRDAMLVAGGTDLYPNMKRRQFEPKVVVGLRGIRELRGVRVESGGWTIGAGTTLSEVSTHPAIARDFPALATAAGLVSSPQLRNMGTIGGNVCVDTRCNYYNQSYEWRKAIGFCMKKDGDICLVAPGSSRCWAVSSSDTAPVLWALGARLRVVGAGGERIVPIAALYRDDGIEYLAKRPDEIVADVLLPPADGWRSAYLKLRRRGSFDFPVLGVAVAARMNGDVVREARIVLGAVASLPRPAERAAAELVGQRITRDLVTRVADLAAGPSKPLDNTDFTHPYRKRVTRVFVARALAAIGGLGDGGPASEEVA